MFRIVRMLILVVLLAVVAGFCIVLYRSPDPTYTVQEWLGGSRFHAYDGIIIDVSKKHGLDPRLVKAVVWRESSFHRAKVGNDGERGLMQVTEGAAADWARAEKIRDFAPTDLFDPKTNIEVGAWYLQNALERWKGKDDPIPFALAEYNAGRQRVHRWIGESNMGQHATADDLRDSIDFPGTKKYVESILSRYDFYKERGRL